MGILEMTRMYHGDQGNSQQRARDGIRGVRLEPTGACPLCPHTSWNWLALGY